MPHLYLSSGGTDTPAAAALREHIREVTGRELMFDAMGTGFNEVRIWRDPACPACGDGASGCGASSCGAARRRVTLLR